MAFPSALTTDPSQIGSGERFTAKSDIILTATTFENGLAVGRFAKVDSGSLDNMDGSATPVIAGVVLRNVARDVESDSAIDASLFDSVSYGRVGMFTVDAKAAETPSIFDAVYVSNQGDADDGLATVTNTDLAARAEYIETIAPNVWLVRLY